MLFAYNTCKYEIQIGSKKVRCLDKERDVNCLTHVDPTDFILSGDVDSCSVTSLIFNFTLSSKMFTFLNNTSAANRTKLGNLFKNGTGQNKLELLVYKQDETRMILGLNLDNLISLKFIDDLTIYIRRLDNVSTNVLHLNDEFFNLYLNLPRNITIYYYCSKIQSTAIVYGKHLSVTDVVKICNNVYYRSTPIECQFKVDSSTCTTIDNLIDCSKIKDPKEIKVVVKNGTIIENKTCHVRSLTLAFSTLKTYTEFLNLIPDIETPTSIILNTLYLDYINDYQLDEKLVMQEKTLHVKIDQLNQNEFILETSDLFGGGVIQPLEFFIEFIDKKDPPSKIIINETIMKLLAKLKIMAPCDR
ncbi:unnamed protein product [Didymodactylos carnosus]|uniref:Uncharacterized protein n=1 Tax=Didymodactylos carnosus TaxID=1234261 RepID=A0A813UEC2_9BILA|nr:unnamed protein product [Didymodactylos carnosus]CAF0826505.1 unnamed protein product [Didymodactylos carnosus]CAF3498321.1 unnamed protein product [Didymodactylos carnosus]CAF3613349.1 unnamed protein product [Didymodactylos carnosus]